MHHSQQHLYLLIFLCAQPRMLSSWRRCARFFHLRWIIYGNVSFLSAWKKSQKMTKIVFGTKIIPRNVERSEPKNEHNIDNFKMIHRCSGLFSTIIIYCHGKCLFINYFWMMDSSTQTELFTIGFGIELVHVTAATTKKERCTFAIGKMPFFKGS